MEKELSLKAFDGKQVECVINTAKKKSDTVVVFVHGLTGSPNEHLYFNAAKLFPKKGIDTFRFSLYEYGKKNRNLVDCGISTHGQDIDRVVKYLRPKYKTIAIVGHSLGSPSILSSNIDAVDIVILWEPSHMTPDRAKRIKTTKLNGQKVFTREGAFDYFMSEKMIREWKEFDGTKELPIIASINKPLLIIGAQKSSLVAGGKKYFKVAQEPKKLVVVDKATHCFDEEGTEEEVLNATLSWVKKHAK